MARTYNYWRNKSPGGLNDLSILSKLLSNYELFLNPSHHTKKFKKISVQTFQAESFNKAKKYLFDKNSCPYKSFAAAAAVAALELFDEVCSAVIFYFSD